MLHGMVWRKRVTRVGLLGLHAVRSRAAVVLGSWMLALSLEPRASSLELHNVSCGAHSHGLSVLYVGIDAVSRPRLADYLTESQVRN